jgi:hypothetical protein
MKRSPLKMRQHYRGEIEYIAINDFGGTEKHQATIN